MERAKGRVRIGERKETQIVFFPSLASSNSKPLTKQTKKTATTAVKRNPNFGKLQAGYLFPEVRGGLKGLFFKPSFDL
jgi:hypothetical protein